MIFLHREYWVDVLISLKNHSLKIIRKLHIKNNRWNQNYVTVPKVLKYEELWNTKRKTTISIINRNTGFGYYSTQKKSYSPYFPINNIFLFPYSFGSNKVSNDSGGNARNSSWSWRELPRHVPFCTFYQVAINRFKGLLTPQIYNFVVNHQKSFIEHSAEEQRK